MKYSRTTTNTLLISILFACFALQSQAQLNTLSPYSRFGLGELETSGPVYNHNLGGISSTLSPFYSVNFDNPASYSNLAHPVFQTSARFSNFTLENSESQERNALSSLNEISVGLPFSSKMALAFGVVPFSSVGYQYSQTAQIADSVEANYLYEGEGGYTRAFIGMSRRKLSFDYFVLGEKGEMLQDSVKYLKSNFSFGVNADVLFGTVEYGRDVLFNNLAEENFNDYYHRIETAKTSIGANSIRPTLGFQYRRNIGINYARSSKDLTKTKDVNLTIGGTYTLNSAFGDTKSVNSKFIQSAYWGAGGLTPQDTLEFYDNLEGNLSIPNKLTLGAAISIEGKNASVWMIAAEMKSQDWSKFQNSLDPTTDIYGLSTYYSLGIEYTPLQFGDENDKKKDKWYNWTSYQFGFKSGINYLKLSDVNITENRASLGVSIPFVGSKTLSRINLGMDFGFKGSTTNGLIRETSVNGFIGLSLMPNMRTNGWFRQSKYQ